MEQFLFGAVYIIEQDYTEEEIRKDLKNLKEYGCNLITLWPIGNAWLAKNSYEWVFAQTRMVLDECKRLEMKAILQLFGQNQTQEFMPDSILTDEMMVVDECGDHINGNAFWANLNHPMVRTYIERFFKAAITEFKNHPAVYGYDVFNEAHFRSDDRLTIGKYQQWLEEKYETIENLNRIWYRRYENFYQVTPKKRKSGYSIWSSVMPDLEYEKFHSENLTELCRFLYETAKKYDASHPIIIDGTSAHIFAEDVRIRNNDEFETAKIPDVYGTTFYPKSWGRNYRDTPWTMSMYYGVPAGAARKANTPYLVSELQTHTQSVLTPGSEVKAQELYDWVLMCIFTGAFGIQLWRWRPFLHGYQATGRGLTRMDGTPNERAARIKELMDVITANNDLFGKFEIAEPVVKIGVSYLSRLFFDAFLKWGKSFWNEDVEGWYRLFWNQGLNPEFTDLEDLEEENAKVLVLPSILNISKKQAKQLSTYVEHGGILIADARLGSVNENGEVPKECIPGAELTKLFGCFETDVDSGHGFYLNGGEKKIPCAFMEQKLEVADDAKVLAIMEDGSPAVVLHPFGKGFTLYFNSFLGIQLRNQNIPEIEQLVMDEISKKYEDLIIAQKNERVHVAYVKSEEKNAVLIVNFHETQETVVLSGMKKGNILTNIMTGDTIVTGEETRILIPENTAYVYRW